MYYAADSGSAYVDLDQTVCIHRGQSEGGLPVCRLKVKVSQRSV